MKRKRKIVKVMKPDAVRLMNRYFDNEHTLAVHGVSVISDKKIAAISNTLSEYAKILWENFTDESEVYTDDWAKELLNFY